MWQLGFVFNKMTFGLLSVFIPLYVAGSSTKGLGGTLVDLGIMISSALLFSIPASFFWGYLCDRTRRYKPFILLSFLSSALILGVFAFATNIVQFMVLYVVMYVLSVAYEAPKNILIAEHYSRDDWEKSYSSYQQVTEVGWLFGLLLGLIASIYSFTPQYTFFLCSALSLTAFFITWFRVADPLAIFERRLVGIERKINNACRGTIIASQLLDGHRLKEKFREDSFFGFGLAIVFFSLASMLFFTPLPIFFAQELGLSIETVFKIYMLNSVGAIAGYFIVKRVTREMDSKKYLRRVILIRSLLVFAAVAIVQTTFYALFLMPAVLFFLNLAYAVYYVLVLSFSMELTSTGRSGIFDVFVGLGTASGSFLGPFIAQELGFLSQFLASGTIFLLAFIILKFSFSSN
jgi:predicted MFS family arabinose efflux permease